MLIGFDLDGVLADINVPLLHSLADSPNRKEYETWYYVCVKPLLDPRLIMLPEDTGVIITSRATWMMDITEKWCRKYYPQFPLHIIDNEWLDPTMNTKDWSINAAKKKYEKMVVLGVELYIDDNPVVVRELRKLGMPALQYGGRIE